MRFIELHFKEDGERCYINVDKILTISPLDIETGAVIIFGKENYAVVEETIDELMIKIRG